MLRTSKDRYRPIFCSKVFYLENQNLFFEWNQLFAKLSSSEKVQAWLVALSLLRRPDDWFGGFRKENFLGHPSHFYKHSLNLKQLATPTSQIQIPTTLKDFNLFEVINRIKIKAVPDSALRALAKLSHPSYPIEIISYVPTPAELLTFQLQGRRILSFNEDFETWPIVLYHGRDFLSFMIHDLIHADHFFATPEHRAGQLGFYRCIEMILPTEDLKTLLKSKKFAEAFEYIISDMNSHPVHLFKTLKACLQQTIENEMKAISLWNNWTSAWSSEDLPANSALQKINTQLFSDKEAINLTEWCIALGHNSRLA